MSDLISRADALEAIKWMPVEDTDAKTVQRCIEAVSNLPSADISHYTLYYGECVGCKYHRVEVEVCKHCARNCDDEYEEVNK